MPEFWEFYIYHGMAVWLSSHEILCSCWLMVRYSLALCAGPFRSGSTLMLLWKTFAYGLNKFPTSQLLSGAFPIHCIEARPGSATLESTELFLFSPYIGGISFSILKNLFPFLFLPRYFFLYGKIFPPSGAQGCCEQKPESIVGNQFSALNICMSEITSVGIYPV